MIESIKKKIEELLAQKKVELAMVYDREGKILWSTGRPIKGKTIDQGEQFPKSDILKSIQLGELMTKEDVVITSSGDGLPMSARWLQLKSIIIQPIDPEFFLYIDSGSKNSFSPADMEVFKVMGELLGGMIAKIKKTGRKSGVITGTSETIKKIRELVLKYSIEDEPVLLTGETGTGKNHLADLIHRFSGLSGNFVEVNVPSIPESLFESELFGHKKGAFSGALNKKGLVEEAAQGTIFFDEIAEVPLTIQTKLLQFMDTQKYRVLGDTKEKQVKTRIIAATIRDLHQEVKHKNFREDLYFRLNVLPIEIPPLRNRKEDIRALIEEHGHILRGKTMGPGFWEAVLNYEWPGNVRELIHVLRRAAIDLPGPTIDREIGAIIQSKTAATDQESESIITTLSEEMENGKSFWDTAWKSFMDRDINRREIRTLLHSWFLKHDSKLNNMSRAMGVTKTEYSRFISALHKYHIHPSKQFGD